MSRKEFRELVPPERAHEVIDSLNLRGGIEHVPLREARGRVLAERIDAGVDVPGFDRASMDGYAVRARDTFGADEADPVVLDLVGEVHAGQEPDVTVEEGAVAEISTGAVMPEGADAVVMVERTDELDSGRGIEIRTSVAPGDHVMFAGADVAAGERALGPGTRLTPREIGLLSALGVDQVPVRDRPRVGIVSTGDELVRPGGTLHSERGQIYDVNSYTIATAVEDAGGEAALYPHVGDDYEEMGRVMVEAAEECDLVLSSGSTSASAVDVIYRVIEERGELLLHGVAVKPGKPMLIGELEESAYVGLPGYPVSALTIFRTFVAPAIRKAVGVPEPRTATIEANMADRERYEGGRKRLMPVGLVESGPPSAADEDETETGEGTADGSGTGEGTTLAYPVDKGSGATTSLVEADGIVEVDPDTAYLDAGERVSVQLFSSAVRPPTLFGVGEDDPALSALLDRLDRPRYLGVGSREGLRRLDRGVPDFAVVSGPVDRDVETVDLGGWTREWGLVVPAGNPEGIEGLTDLVDRKLQFVNRTTDSGLRATLTDTLANLAEDRDSTHTELVKAIDGFDLAVRAHESPARKVAAERADAGLGLRATAEKLDLGFVPVGEERISVFGNPGRVGKESVERLRESIAEQSFEELPGYHR